MKDRILEVVTGAAEALFISEIPSVADMEFEVGAPKKKEFGDFSTNAALVIGNAAGRSPREVAELMVGEMAAGGFDFIEKLEVAGPGFINFFVSETAFGSGLREIVRLDDRYGSLAPGEGEKVVVEFVSANPTGYLHFGHARNAVVGDSVCRILSFAGRDVTREFYINDAGRQMDMLGESVYAMLARMRGVERRLPEDGYRGEYVAEIAAEINASDECPEIPGDESRAVGFCRDFAYARLLEEIRSDLRDLRVDFDVWYSEKKEIHSGGGTGDGKIPGALAALEAAAALKEEDGALWFRASEHGDSKDWVLVKKDGSPTYFVSDIAYHLDKYSRGFSRLINVWGADHHSHVSRLKASMRALGRDASALRVLLIQFVRLVRDGEEVAMSKRSGDFLTLRDVLREAGRDATRFFLLMRSSDSHLDFDLSLARRQSSENPVYYVQYACARISSLTRKAGERGIEASDSRLDLLSDDAERDIAKRLLRFRETVLSAAETLSPHKVVYYLQELASEFHFYYNKTKILDSENADEASARLYLARCVRTVLRNGLGLLGIDAPERM